jgi:hypothetical protein
MRRVSYGVSSSNKQQIQDEFEGWTADPQTLWLESEREAHIHERDKARLLQKIGEASRQEIRRLSHWNRGYHDDEKTGLDTNTRDNAHLELYGNMKNVHDPQFGATNNRSRGLKRPAREEVVSATKSKLESDSSVTQSTKRRKAIDAENTTDAAKDTWINNKSVGNSPAQERVNRALKNRMKLLKDENVDLKNEVADFKDEVYDLKRQREPWKAKAANDATIVNALPLVGFSDDGSAERGINAGRIEKTLNQIDAQTHPNTALPTVRADDPSSSSTHASRSLDIAEIDLQTAHTFPTEDVVAYIHQLQLQVEKKDKLLVSMDRVLVAKNEKIAGLQRDIGFHNYDWENTGGLGTSSRLDWDSSIGLEEDGNHFGMSPRPDLLPLATLLSSFPQSPLPEEQTPIVSKSARVRRPIYPSQSPPSLAIQTKVRSGTGCGTCRKRKKKCDETKPFC